MRISVKYAKPVRRMFATKKCSSIISIMTWIRNFSIQIIKNLHLILANVKRQQFVKMSSST